MTTSLFFIKNMRVSHNIDMHPFIVFIAFLLIATHFRIKYTGFVVIAERLNGMVNKIYG